MRICSPWKDHKRLQHGFLKSKSIEDEGKRVFFSFLVLPICTGWIAQSYPWNQNVNSSMVYPITFQCFYQSSLCSYCHQPPVCCPCSYSPVSGRSPHTITHVTLFNSKLVTFLASWRIATLLRAQLYLTRQWPTGICAVYLYLVMLAYPPHSLPHLVYTTTRTFCASLSSVNYAWLVFTSGPLYKLWLSSVNRIFLHPCAQLTTLPPSNVAQMQLLQWGPLEYPNWTGPS